jgi:hypothetical protein
MAERGVLVMMTTPIGALGSVLAPEAFFGDAGALGSGGGGLLGGLAITAVGAYPLVVDLAGAAVRFAAVATLAQQLDVGRIVLATA